MGRAAGGAWAVLAVVAALAAAADGGPTSDVETSASEVAFLAPAVLAGAGEPYKIKHRSALFGASDYGKFNNLQANVEFDVGDGAACPTKMDKIAHGDLPTLLVVMKYDSCAFVAEALNAQARAAHGLLVVENVCLKENEDKFSDKEYCSKLGKSQLELSYMAGADNTVHIPAMIISHYDGMRLFECNQEALGKLPAGYKYLTDVEGKCASKPLVSLRWNIPRRKHVEWNLWTSSLLNADVFVRPAWVDKVIPKLLEDEATLFTPHYFVWDGKALNCVADSANAAHCKDACHNKGRYCHFDPDGLGKGKISGRRVSQENLRQKCAWEAAADTERKIKWWKYVSLVAEFCSGKNNTAAYTNKEAYYTEECSKGAHEEAGLSWKDTMACIKSAENVGYEADIDSDISLWQTELAERKKREIERLPTLYVASRSVDFGASMKNVLTAICAGFEADHEPKFCPCVQSNDVSQFTDDNLVQECFGSPETGIGLGALFVVLFFVVAGLVAVYLYVRRYDKKNLRDEVHEDVRNIIGEYVRMDNDESGSFRGADLGTAIGSDADGDDAERGRGNGVSGGQYRHVAALE